MSDTPLRVVLVGAASYVFGPAMLEQCLLEHRLNGIHLCLVDLDEDVLELLVQAAQRIAEDAGIDATISASTDRRAALMGANYVICAVSYQTLSRFFKDKEVIAKYAPEHLITDFGGVAGISYTLRQAVLMQGIAADIKAVCPEAYLLSVSNPLPRLCQLTQAMGVNTIGLCSVALNGYRMLAGLLENADVSYPFASYRERWEMRAAGLNHLSWLLGFRERDTGEDLLPRLREAVAQRGIPGQPLSTNVFRETGFLPLAGDDHIRDFFKPHPEVGSMEHASHGSAGERERRLEFLKQVAARQTGYAPLFVQKSWERPFAVIEALQGENTSGTHVLNLVNRGQVLGLPEGVFVETLCKVSQAGLEPLTSPLPEEVAPLTTRAAQVHDLVVQGILTKSKAPLYHALELDATVTVKRSCIEALEGCLAAHDDILPTYDL